MLFTCLFPILNAQREEKGTQTGDRDDDGWQDEEVHIEGGIPRQFEDDLGHRELSSLRRHKTVCRHIRSGDIPLRGALKPVLSNYSRRAYKEQVSCPPLVEDGLRGVVEASGEVHVTELDVHRESLCNRLLSSQIACPLSRMLRLTHVASTDGVEFPFYEHAGPAGVFNEGRVARIVAVWEFQFQPEMVALSVTIRSYVLYPSIGGIHNWEVYTMVLL